MSKRNGLPDRAPPVVGVPKTTVVSKPGAAVRVERIELSEVARRSLMTHASSLGAPVPMSNPSGGAGGRT